MLNDILDYLNPYYIALSFLLIFTIVLLIRKKDCFKKEENKEEKYQKMLNSLGGINNIKNVKRVSSRIDFEVKEKKDINKQELKEKGIKAIVVTSKKITLVVGKEAKALSEYIEKQK